MLGPATDPAVRRQQHPQPPRADVDAGLLFQVAGQPLRGPDVAAHPQRARVRLQCRLQRRQIPCIRPHRAAAAWRVVEGGAASSRKARQPVGHRRFRAPAPAGDALSVIAQRRCFDHFQPFAHPPRQIGAPQLGFNGRALLRHDAAHRDGWMGRGVGFVSIHLHAPLLRCSASWSMASQAIVAQRSADRVPPNLPAHT